ncbi:hypothetical protein BJ742DRAFT_742286 [Cladochytrium replicatum]|nr:hypothetical protein BJ742DRAFT_742286 [Cladochytrium replicatum]
MAPSSRFALTVLIAVILLVQAHDARIPGPFVPLPEGSVDLGNCVEDPGSCEGNSTQRILVTTTDRNGHLESALFAIYATPFFGIYSNGNISTTTNATMKAELDDLDGSLLLLTNASPSAKAIFCASDLPRRFKGCVTLYMSAKNVSTDIDTTEYSSTASASWDLSTFDRNLINKNATKAARIYFTFYEGKQAFARGNFTFGGPNGTFDAKASIVSYTGTPRSSALGLQSVPPSLACSLAVTFIMLLI